MRLKIGKVNPIVEKTLLTFVFSVILSGCGKWSHNDHLDGQWQVMEVTYSGVPVNFPEGERFYYNFYLHTFSLGFTDSRPGLLKGNMTYDDKAAELYLDFSYIKEGRLQQKWKDRLIYWGMPASGDMHVNIRELTSKRLVMEYDDVVIVCRKF